MPSTDSERRNKAALDAGFKRAKQLIAEHVGKRLQSLSQFITQAAYNSKGFQSFTGNAENAIAAVTYANQTLVGVAHPSSRTPLRLKIQRGEHVHLKTPMEGAERTVHGAVEIVVPDVMQGVTAIAAIPVVSDFKPMASTRFIYAIEYGTGEKTSTPLRLMHSFASRLNQTDLG
mgnify:FL=1